MERNVRGDFVCLGLCCNNEEWDEIEPRGFEAGAIVKQCATPRK